MATAGTVLPFAQTPQFRAGVTLVPVEVRVLDDEGRPVTGLTAEDFTIREERVVQPIAHFRAISLEGVSGPTSTARTFVIVLGRGRLNEPTKALQALSNFVRSSVLPGDRIGVVAFLRASALTTDHERMARFLDIYRERHERIDGLIAGDRRASRVPMIGQNTRTAIDALFQSAAGLRFQDLPGGAGTAASRYNDFRYLTSTLQHLSTIEGEKHVVFVSEQALSIGRMPDDPLKQYWVGLTTSARSTLTVIHAGGLPGESLYRGRLITNRRARGGDTAFGGGLDFGNVADTRIVAELTGGTATFFQYADRPLAALDRATRSYYVLGYYPQLAVAPDEARRVEVSVRRLGVSLQYRHGYQARPRIEGPQDFRRALADMRIAEAASRLVTPIRSNVPFSMGLFFRWRLRLTVPDRNSPPASGSLRATVAFDPTWVTFIKDGEDHITDLDLVLFADDEERAVVGERRVRLNIRLTAAEYARIQREWLSYDASVDVTAKPAYLRAVLYDFETDRTASAQVRLTR